MSLCKNYFEEGVGQYGIDGRLMEAGSREARRKIVIILLKSDGGMVTRTGNVRKCNECLEDISESVFIHRNRRLFSS